MNRNVVGWLFVLPAALHLAVFALGPIGYAAALSLFDWDLLKGESRFVGLENYARLGEDGKFAQALMNSAIYTVFSVPLGLAVALGVGV